MTRSALTSALVLLVLSLPAGLARADYDPARWRFLRPFDAGAEGFIRVELDRGVYARSAPDFTDLRVLVAEGEEVPHVLRQYVPRTESTFVPARVLNLGERPGEQTVFEIDAGERADLPAEHRAHNRVELDLDGQDFVRRVEISASDDRQQWLRLVADALVFDYRARRGLPEVRQSAVGYPSTDLRYLRVSLLGGEGPMPRVADARLARLVDVPGEIRFFEVAVRAHTSADRVSRVDFDLGSDAAPVDAVEPHVADPLFARAVEIHWSPDGKSWRSAGYGGHISRLRVGGDQAKLVESLSIPSVGVRTRHLRLVITNGDDAPLDVKGATISYYPHFVVLRAEPGKRYQLACGNPKARAPRYDLAQQLDSASPELRPGPGLGAEIPNPRYAPPVAPLTERLPWLPNVALGAGALALALVLLRAIRRGRRVERTQSVALSAAATAPPES